MFIQERLLKMKNATRRWCISFYLLIDENNVQINRSKLRKLMFKAEEKLIDLGLSLKSVAKMLLPIEEILENNSFWQNRKNGIVIFLSANSCQLHNLPGEPFEISVISHSFFREPLYISNDKPRSKNILGFTRMKIKRLSTSELVP